jgi:hypothetical protein
MKKDNKQASSLRVYSSLQYKNIVLGGCLLVLAIIFYGVALLRVKLG